MLLLLRTARTFQLVGQAHQALRQMYILQHRIRREMKIGGRKIPECPDPIGNKLCSNLRRILPRDRQRGNIHSVVAYKIGQLLHGPDLEPPHLLPQLPRINVKNAAYQKSPSLKIRVICQRLTEIPGSDNDDSVFLIQSQNSSDLRIQVLHIITVALLPEAAEMIQILAYLRCRYIHFFTQLLGRNTHDIFFEQLSKVTVIPRQALYHRC